MRIWPKFANITSYTQSAVYIISSSTIFFKNELWDRLVGSMIITADYQNFELRNGNKWSTRHIDDTYIIED
jgi:hypothetical protein